MKKLFLLFLLSLGLVSNVSAETVQKLLITKADGSEVKFNFSDAPVVAFSETYVEVRVAGETELLFPLTDYAKFTFIEEEEEPDAVAELAASTTEEFKLRGGNIQASGLTPGALVRVYSVNGQQVSAAKADDNGQLSISLSDASAGIYIVKSSKTTFKFIKK